jgi:sorting nexin-7/30/sorting nexin-8
MDNFDDSVNIENNSKLNLIKREITNKNYAKRDFMNFCLFKKKNGDNIDNWTMDELSSLVHEFQQSNSPQEEIDNDIYNEENDIEDNYFENENENEDDKMNNLFIEEETNNKINDAAVDLSNSEKHIIRYKKGRAEKIIKCQTLEKTILNDKKIVVNIKDPKEINGGIFSSNYISYSVETQPMGWVVQRRDSDFDLLRKLLLKYFPFHKIDPLPKRKMPPKNLMKILYKKEYYF